MLQDNLCQKPVKCLSAGEQGQRAGGALWLGTSRLRAGFGERSALTDNLRGPRWFSQTPASLFRSDSTLETFPLSHTLERSWGPWSLPARPFPPSAALRAKSCTFSAVSPLGSCGFRVWGLAPWPRPPGHTVVLVVAVCLEASLLFKEHFV